MAEGPTRRRFTGNSCGARPAFVAPRFLFDEMVDLACASLPNSSQEIRIERKIEIKGLVRSSFALKPKNKEPFEWPSFGVSFRIKKFCLGHATERQTADFMTE